MTVDVDIKCDRFADKCDDGGVVVQTPKGLFRRQYNLCAACARRAVKMLLTYDRPIPPEMKSYKE